MPFSFLRPWLLLCAVTVAVGFGGFVAVREVERSVHQHVAEHLELMLTGTAMMLDYGFGALAGQARSIAASDDVRRAAAEAEKDPNAFIARVERLEPSPKPLGYVLTAADGRVLYGAPPFAGLPARLRLTGRIGDVRFSAPAFAPELSAAPPGSRAIVLAAATAIGDQTLWILHDARRLFASVLLPGRSGTTGEIYAFDADGVMLSDSRFNEMLYETGLLPRGHEAALELSVRDPQCNMVAGCRPAGERSAMPLTVAAAGAIRDRRGVDVEGFRDYRGVPVVGAWRWFDDLGFGVTHEIDVDEAYYNVAVLKTAIFGLFGVLGLATAAAGLLAMRASRAELQRRQSEERLFHLNGEISRINRLATMGEMATGLAHEINQPLAAISNFARAALNELSDPTLVPGERVRERLAQIERNALRSGEVIRRLRKYVGQQEATRAPVAVAGLVRDPLSLLGSELRESGVTVKVEVPDSLPAILGDEVQLQQVLLNLVRNAVDAMRKVDGRERCLTLSARDGGERVLIDVADTGPGIEPAVLARLFEQFNSSTPGGMGLGLAISRTIVDAHGGDIVVTRNSGEGVTFEVALPRC